MTLDHPDGPEVIAGVHVRGRDRLRGDVTVTSAHSHAVLTASRSCGGHGGRFPRTFGRNAARPSASSAKPILDPSLLEFRNSKLVLLEGSSYGFVASVTEVLNFSWKKLIMTPVI